MDANKTAGEEARRQLHKNAACNLEQVLAATPHKTPTVRPPAPYHEKRTRIVLMDGKDSSFRKKGYEPVTSIPELTSENNRKS